MTQLQNTCTGLLYCQQDLQQINAFERVMVARKVPSVHSIVAQIAKDRASRYRFMGVVAQRLARFAAANDNSMTPEAA